MTAQEKQMEVCEVCGAFLIIGDAQTRVDDHLQGKQHMGYAKIKSTIEELKVRAVWNVNFDPFTPVIRRQGKIVLLRWLDWIFLGGISQV